MYPAFFRVPLAVTGSVSPDTTTQLEFGIPVFDTAAMDNGDDSWSPTYDGYYTIILNVGFSSAASMNGDNVTMSIEVDGVEVWTNENSPGGNSNPYHNASVTMYLTTTSVVTAHIWHSEAAAQPISSSVSYMCAYPHGAYLNSNLTADVPFSGAYVYRLTDQSVGTGSATPVTWTAEYFDTDNYWTSGTDITVPSTGYYLIGGSVYWAGDMSDDWTWIGVRINGASKDQIAYESENTNWLAYPFAGLHYLTAGDVITMAVQQNSGSNKNLLNSTAGTHLYVQRLFYVAA